MPARPHRRPTPWAAAGVPLLLTGLVTGALTMAPSPSTAAASTVVVAAVPSPAAELAVAPTTVKQGNRSVTVDPAANIGATEAAITVKGSGFKTDDDLWVAVCLADGKAPKDMSACLGGPIPDNNATTSWGVVTNNAADVPPGPVPAKWDGDGFSLTLQVAAANDHVDCSSQKCSVYVRGAGSSRSQDMAVPVAFAAAATSPAPTTSSSATTSSAAPTSATSTAPTSTSVSTTASAVPTTSSSAPTTSSSPEPVPTTVGAQSVLLKDVTQGRSQVVVFTGFEPNEPVDVALSGNAAKLPSVRADGSGAVRVTWAVPANFPIGGYTLRVTGRNSLRVGEAGFNVIAAPVTSSSAATTQASSSASSVASSAPASVAAPASPTSSASSVASSATSAASPAPVTSSSAVGTPADSGSGTPWWLWITLAVVLLVGLVVAAVAMGRRHREETDAERDRREAELAAAAQAEALRHPTPRPPAPPVPGFDEHPDRPILFSHRQAEDYTPPTEAIGDPNAPTQAIGDPNAPTQAAGSPGQNQPGGRHAAPAEGPGTQQFDPFADDEDSGPDDQAHGPGGNRPDDGGNTAQWRPPSD